MSCENCYNGCGTVTSDECVKYTGETVESLGITNGDPLAKVEEIILAKLQEYAQGEGITLDCVDLKCDFIEGLLGCCKDKSLCNIIQALVDASCSLKDSVEALSGQVASPYVFTLLCLAGDLPANPTRDQIIQAIINKLCAVSTKVDVIYGDYVKASQLNTLIANYLSGVGASAQQYTKMVPYVAYEYYGPLSNFDGAGKGLSAFGFDKVYLCVGQTVSGYVLPDKRGRVAVGVPSMPGGPALDSAVDYALPQNAGTNYTLKQKFGQYFYALTVNQLAAHSHIATAVTNPHTHNILGITGGDDNNNNNIYRFAGGDKNQGESGFYFTNTTACQPADAISSVSIASTGNSEQHENRQPSVAAYYIMYIP